MTTIQQIAAVHPLHKMGYRYSESMWLAWRAGKTKALDNKTNPFMGGPLDLGLTEIEGVGGKVIKIGPLTRLKYKDLSDASLEKLGILDLKKGIGDGNPDVVHQEYVPDFATNVANDDAHLLNNFAAVSGLIDYIFGHQWTTNNTTDEVAKFLRAVAEDPRHPMRQNFTDIARALWIGRVCFEFVVKPDTSRVRRWTVETANDFRHIGLVSKVSAELDNYVVIPILTALATDLETDYYKVPANI